MLNLYAEMAIFWSIDHVTLNYCYKLFKSFNDNKLSDILWHLKVKTFIKFWYKGLEVNFQPLFQPYYIVE